MRWQGSGVVVLNPTLEFEPIESSPVNGSAYGGLHLERHLLRAAQPALREVGRVAGVSGSSSRLNLPFSAEPFVSHSQMVYELNPIASISAVLRASLARLDSNFWSQKLRFVVGVVAWAQLGWRCQKHPFT